MMETIIALEWSFFQEVENIGGRADCQDDYKTFYIMRKSQYLCWNENALKSYLKDLEQYKNNNQNPMYYKYAYMMKSTDPDAYKKIEKTLPKIEQQQAELMEAIISIQLQWKIECNEQYPAFKQSTRAIYSSDDTIEETSFETYLRGELYTYSPKTLYEYGQMIVEMLKHNQNIITETLSNTVKQYGYTSLSQAQEQWKD